MKYKLDKELVVFKIDSNLHENVIWTKKVFKTPKTIKVLQTLEIDD